MPAPSDPRFTVQVSNVDYNSVRDLSHYNLESLITTLQDYFPSARFEITLQPPITSDDDDLQQVPDER